MKMTYSEIQTLLSDELAATDQLIRSSLHSEVELINSIGDHIVNAGGKRIRPVLALLVAKALGYGDQNKEDQHCLLAAIIELIHTATLLHDDVVDNSSLRRGEQTANAIWDNTASVLSGDFLYSRAFQLMVQFDRIEILKILADASNIIAQGEVAQLQNCHKIDVSVEDYFNVIEGKTAALFAASTEIASLLAGAEKTKQAQLRQMGIHLGNAFQIADDVMDYMSDAKQMGKSVGDDLAEGKPTLPLILAMQMAKPHEVELIQKAIQTADNTQIDQIIQILQSSGALAASIEMAMGESQKAADLMMTYINESQHRDALLSLCQLAVARVA